MASRIGNRLMFYKYFRSGNLLKYKKVDISPVVTHKPPLKVFHKSVEAVISWKKEMGRVVFFPEAN